MSQRAIRVVGTPEFNLFYSSLLAGSPERTMIDKGLDRLKENIASGEKVQKTQWPPLYLRRDRVTNLWKLNLSKQARLIYSIFSDS